MNSNIIDKITLYIKNPLRIIQYGCANGLFNLLSDRIVLKMAYYSFMHRTLNLDFPRTFNEKLQWLKLYNRNPEYTNMVDKFSVKEHVGRIIGNSHIIPTLGVWDSFDDINFNDLPSQFVLKCTHDSGGIVICKNKDLFDKEAAKRKLNRSLRRDYYKVWREWPYKNVKHRIIAEKYMENSNGELEDYKFMCFNGKVKCCFTCSERFSDDGLKVTFYDNDWKIMPFERHYPALKKEEVRPKSFEQMIYFAELLSKDIPFVRIDFYEINDTPYFGEITFFPGSGFEEFTPEEWDEILGSWIELPNYK